MFILAVLIAGIIYYVLGGIWFTPLFGRQWEKAIGFDRPSAWKPGAIYYVGPLIGCLMASAASGILIYFIQPETLPNALLIGLIIGLGYGVTITGVNAISPNMPRPGLYVAVTGSYHLTGLVLCSAILFWML